MLFQPSSARRATSSSISARALGTHGGPGSPSLSLSGRTARAGRRPAAVFAVLTVRRSSTLPHCGRNQRSSTAHVARPRLLATATASPVPPSEYRGALAADPDELVPACPRMAGKSIVRPRGAASVEALPEQLRVGGWPGRPGGRAGPLRRRAVRFCLQPDAAWSTAPGRAPTRQAGTLNSEGRSTPRPSQPVAVWRCAARRACGTGPQALSFTDNRQDASLSRSLNDFVEIGVLRAALYRAVSRPARPVCATTTGQKSSSAEPASRSGSNGRVRRDENRAPDEAGRAALLEHLIQPASSCGSTSSTRSPVSRRSCQPSLALFDDGPGDAGRLSASSRATAIAKRSRPRRRIAATVAPDVTVEIMSVIRTPVQRSSNRTRWRCRDAGAQKRRCCRDPLPG